MKTLVLPIILLLALGGCAATEEIKPQESEVKTTRYFIFFYRYPKGELYSRGQYGAWSTKGIPSFKTVELKVAKGTENVTADDIDITNFKEVNEADFICLFQERIIKPCH